MPIPISRSYGPPDLAATIYQALGVDPATELRDRLGRPLRLCSGQMIAPLYTTRRSDISDRSRLIHPVVSGPTQLAVSTDRHAGRRFLPPARFACRGGFCHDNE